MDLQLFWVQRLLIWLQRFKCNQSAHHRSPLPLQLKSLREMETLKHCWNPKRTYTHCCKDEDSQTA
ncbi:Uncharacterized protein DAT39_008614 [Clarias magur]|uniref:Uncharacterized protein n=1 Tax=Clarias magur TaxID=1594786 RepID=A0A8J4U9W8_CLAMG|nr:Uncharacterized protein DAT39_008614 [Clarias magur]